MKTTTIVKLANSVVHIMQFIEPHISIFTVCPVVFIKLGRINCRNFATVNFVIGNEGCNGPFGL